MPLRALPSADDSVESLTPIEEGDLLFETLRGRVPPEAIQSLRQLDIDSLRRTAAELFAAQEGTRESLSEVVEGITTARQARSAAMGGAIRAALENPDAMPLPRMLREHQEETLARTADFLSAGYQRGLIVLPTGTGKTVIMSSILRLTGARALIVVPTKPILAQTIAECGMYLDAEGGGRAPIGHVSSVDPETVQFAPSSHHAQIVVTTLNSLRLRAEQFAKEAWDLVFVDEAHTAVTQNVQQALRLLGGVPKIGFTATPDYIYTSPIGPRKHLEEVEIDGRTMWRDTNRSASRYFPHEIVRVPLREAISEGLVCPVRAAIVRIDVPLDDVPINAVGGKELDYNEAALAEQFDRRWDVIAGAVLDVYTNAKQTTGITGFEHRRAMAVLPTVVHAERLAAELKEYGLTAAAISGKTPDTERDAILEAHRRGEIQILTSVKVLSMGWDSPQTEVLLMLRPTRSRLLYEQLLGRVLRLNPDDPGKEALVIDFLGAYVDHAPLTTPTLFGEQSLHNGQLLVEPRVPREVTIQRVAGGTVENLAPRYDISTELIVIEEGKREIPVSRDAEGFVVHDSVRLGTIKAWVRYLGFGEKAIKDRLRGAEVHPTVLYVSALQAYDFYPEAAVRAACADLFDTDVLPEQDDGTFRNGEIVYRTVSGLARELGVSDPTVSARIDAAQIPAKQGRLKGGQLCAIYPEAAVRTACADLLNTEALSEQEDGTFRDGEAVYRTAGRFAQELGLGRKVVSARIDAAQIPAKQGRLKGGQLCAIYPEAAVRTACADFLNPDVLPEQDDGTFRDGEAVYRTVSGLARELGVTDPTVSARIDAAQIPAKQGRMKKGNIHSIYPEAAVRTACADFLNPDVLPEQDDGTFRDGEAVYRTAGGFSRAFGVSESAIKSRIDAARIPAKLGRGKISKLRFVYPEAAVRAACADLLEE